MDTGSTNNDKKPIFITKSQRFIEQKKKLLLVLAEEEEQKKKRMEVAKDQKDNGWEERTLIRQQVQYSNPITTKPFSSNPPRKLREDKEENRLHERQTAEWRLLEKKAEREGDKELEAIKDQYLRSKKPKRRAYRAGLDRPEQKKVAAEKDKEIMKELEIFLNNNETSCYAKKKQHSEDVHSFDMKLDKHWSEKTFGRDER